MQRYPITVLLGMDSLPVLTRPSVGSSFPANSDSHYFLPRFGRPWPVRLVRLRRPAEGVFQLPIRLR